MRTCKLTNILARKLENSHIKAMKQLMQNHRKLSSKHLLISAILFLLVITSSAVAQDNSRLDISDLDGSGFPIIQLNVIAADGTSVRLGDLTGLSLSENDSPVDEIAMESVAVGTELFILIDANTNIAARDQAGDLTRLEKVRDSIISYASQYMDEGQLDQVTIIVPGDGGAAVLLDQSSFPNAVINEINFYEPDLVDSTPLNEMMLLALEKAAGSHAEGRFQSILLFSDAGLLEQQLDYPTLVDQAKEINIPIFGAILGAAADANEIDNISRLSDPTRGSYLHMVEAASADPIYALIQDHRPQIQIQYRSQAATSGPQTVTIELAGITAEGQYDLELLPPTAELLIDNTQPIRRVFPSADSPLTAAEPTIQPIAAQVMWPDEHPRLLTSATLVVNGVPQLPVIEPPVTPDGLLTLDWDISNLDEGSFGLSIQLVDELNQQSLSDPLPMSVVVEGKAVAPVEPELQPTVAPERSPVVDSESLLENLGIVGIALGVLALLVALVVLIFAISVVRRRRPAAAAASVAQPAVDQQPASYDHESTQVLMPAFAGPSGAIGYLEPLENATDHSDNIPLSAGNIAIGRDPKLVQVKFSHKSVSRLHARILEKGGVYQLYDEGSASGTYINFEQISLQPQRLNDNDDIHFGQVHVRFHVTPGADDHDSTQVMPSPIQPGRPTPQAPAVDDDMSTQPYMPNQPPSPGAGSAPPPPDDDDEDDLSTQPYMPHTPR